MQKIFKGLDTSLCITVDSGFVRLEVVNNAVQKKSKIKDRYVDIIDIAINNIGNMRFHLDNIMQRHNFSKSLAYAIFSLVFAIIALILSFIYTPQLLVGVALFGVLAIILFFVFFKRKIDPICYCNFSLLDKQSNPLFEYLLEQNEENKYSVFQIFDQIRTNQKI